MHSLTGEKGTVNTCAPPGLRMRRSSWKPWYGRGMRDISCRGWAAKQGRRWVERGPRGSAWQLAAASYDGAL